MKVSVKDKMVKGSKKESRELTFFYTMSLLGLVFGVANVIGWDSWLLDLFGLMFVVLGTMLNVITTIALMSIQRRTKRGRKR